MIHGYYLRMAALRLIAFVCLMAGTGLASAAGLTVRGAPETFVPNPACRADALVATFAVSYEDPTIHQEAIQYGLESVNLTVAFGVTGERGRITRIDITDTANRTYRFPGTSQGQYSLTSLLNPEDGPGQAIIVGRPAGATLLPIKTVVVYGFFGTVGSKTITLDAIYRARVPMESFQGSGTVTGLILEVEETLVLTDQETQNFKTDADSTGPPPHLPVCADTTGKGRVKFQLACPDTSGSGSGSGSGNNASYPFVLSRLGNPERVIAQGTLRSPDFSGEQLNLLPGRYTIVVNKAGSSNSDFARQIDFTVIDVTFEVVDEEPTPDPDPNVRDASGVDTASLRVTLSHSGVAQPQLIPSSRFTMSAVIENSIAIGFRCHWCPTLSELGSGVHTVSVSAKDLAGNLIAPTTFTFTLP